MPLAKIPGTIVSNFSILPTVHAARHGSEKQEFGKNADDTVRKLWCAVEQSPDPVLITDGSGVIEYVNPGFEILTGYSKEQAIGQTPRILRSETEPAETYKELWQTILSGNTFRGVLVNRKRNGESFSVEKTITPLRDSAGKVSHFISTDRDITERCRLELQLQQARKMDAIGRLAGGVAHDFNNLLMVISSYGELMLDSLGGEASHAEERSRNHGGIPARH